MIRMLFAIAAILFFYQSYVYPSVTYAQEQRLSYFNPSLPDTNFASPFETNVEIAMVLGERMTLPSANGFVDSVSVVFTAVQGDSVAIALVQDTLLVSKRGTSFHYMDLWDYAVNALWNNIIPAGGVYWSGMIPASHIVAGQHVTVRVPHVPVPQNFFVAIAPRLAGGTNSSAFLLEGDTEAHFVRTADNTRSALISYDQFSQSYDSQPLDSAEDFSLAFYYGDGIYTNLDMAAYVQPGSADVAPAATLPKVSLYPNPATSRITFDAGNSDIPASLVLMDMLGRIVLSSKFRGATTLDVSQLESGRYEAIVTGTSGSIRAPVIIAR